MAEKTHFTVMVTGQVESAEIPNCDSACCKMLITYGADWSVLDGATEGLSQITRRGAGPDASLVWNFPIDVTFKSTNAYGWPQIVLSVYEVDGLGRDLVKGYGCIHLPIAAGRYVRRVHLFRPISASLVQQFYAWAVGEPAEYTDPKFVARSDGREVTRVESVGVAYVTFNVMTKDMGVFGYSEDPGPAAGNGGPDGFRTL